MQTILYFFLKDGISILFIFTILIFKSGAEIGPYNVERLIGGNFEEMFIDN